MVYQDEGAELLPAMPQNQIQVKDQAAQQMAVISHLSELALSHPRDESRALQKVLEAADDSSKYAIPNRGEGLTVNIARTAIRHYRNCFVSPPEISDTMMNRNGQMVPGWSIKIYVIDIENLFTNCASGTVAKPEMKHNEKPLAYDQRCFQTQLAFIGRLERNAIMKVIPGEWKDQIMHAVEAKQKMKPLSQRIARVVEQLESIGVNKAMAKRITGCAPTSWSEGQWANMQGRVSAIKNEGLPFDDVFPELAKDEEKKEAEAKPKAAPLPKVNELYANAEKAGYDRKWVQDQSQRDFGKAPENLTEEEIGNLNVLIAEAAEALAEEAAGGDMFGGEETK